MHDMNRGCKASGVNRIRIHDLRHSYVSLLINMGFSALDIAELDEGLQKQLTLVM
ncbi:hypothetical protein [Bifidobacterium pseudocatenulatum]|uniref:hypothetical protein n=1 Tax=Bifidobacterium pseudocatenulatum TaxID=28026 RepID=UPI00216B5F06|nr:hypothetical protein [Bifidobacterium pseudocatenulatum]